MTDNETIKALECCGRESCFGCPYHGKCHQGNPMIRDALNLITRQQLEIENLKVENQSLRSAANSLKMHYEEAQAEIERLKTELDFAKAFRKETDAEFSLMHRKYGNMLKAAKSEAYKELAEKAKEFMHNKFKDLDEYEFEYITERDINNLIKETEGENNA